MNAYARSLLIYIGTPMVAAGIWKRGEIESIEKAIYKKAAMVPNNIDPGLVTNLMRQKQGTWLIIDRLSSKIKL